MVATLDFLVASWVMFIRQTRTNNKATGESYTTHRLVRSERIGARVRQITLLNLGRHFPIRQEDWPLLCSRIDALIGCLKFMPFWGVDRCLGVLGEIIKNSQLCGLHVI